MAGAQQNAVHVRRQHLLAAFFDLSENVFPFCASVKSKVSYKLIRNIWEEIPLRMLFVAVG